MEIDKTWYPNVKWEDEEPTEASFTTIDESELTHGKTAKMEEVPDDRAYCKEHCKGYRESGGKCYFGFNCSVKKEAEAEKKWIPKFKEGDLFTYNDTSNEAKLYTVKRLEQHGCVAGYWCEQFDAPTKGNFWFSSLEEKYMEPYEPEPEEEDANEYTTEVAYNTGYSNGYDAGFEEGKKVTEWSEEDEKMLSDCIEEVGSMSIRGDVKTLRDWLKSLPERFNLQPKQEWSEEDEKIRRDTIRILETASPIPQANGKVQLRFSKNILWLKSLRPQSHWKPSEEQKPSGFSGELGERLKALCPQLEYERGVKDGIQSEKNHHWKPTKEQMDALYNVEFKNVEKFGPILNSLYNDLKKL